MDVQSLLFSSCDCTAADKATSTLSASWLGVIPFLIYVVHDELTPSTMELPADGFITDNICRYFVGGMYPVTRLYFYGQAYPPPSSVDEIDSHSSGVHSGFEDFRCDLCVATLTAGNPVCPNSHAGGPVGTRAFQCSC